MRYTYVKQQDATDCAAACIAMICLHYKKETTISKLRDMMGTDIKGTNLIGIKRSAERLGLLSQAVKVDKEGFLSGFTLPAIANVITPTGLSHFVVVFKITKDYVVVGDPGSDLSKQSLDEFFKTFTGTLVLFCPNDDFSAGKNSKSTMFERYIKLLSPQKKLFAYGIISSFLITILGIGSSIFNNVIYDEILPYGQIDMLKTVLAIFLGIAITNIVLGFVRQWMMYFLSIRIDIPLMLGYFRHIFKLPMKFFATRRTGDITTRFSDACTIKSIFTNIALTLVMDITTASITGIILIRMNTNMFAIIGFMTIISVLLVLVFKQPYKKINEEQMQQASTLNSQIIEGLRAIETIKCNANEEIELENLEKEYIRSLKIGYKENILSSIQGTISGAISTVGNLVLTYTGIIQVIEGKTTLGTMMAFMTLANYFMSPIGRLVGLQFSIQEANISMKRLSEVLDYETEQESYEKKNFKELEKVEGDICIKDLTFRYGNRKPVLKNVSFTIPKGKKVALVGASGSGKSTIAKLILKYYRPESGQITINGIDIEEYSNDSLRRAISYMPQAVELFSKSIFDNIRVSKMDASLEEVQVAARYAGAEEFISKQPLQYNTYLEEAGNGLSGGEKQRIALARAFLKNNEFYIFDEGTSNLDFATENTIFDMIYNHFRNKSMLIISHRLATVKECDMIFVINNGEIVERGKHEDLMRDKGEYYRLWELQQGNIISSACKEEAEAEVFYGNELSYT